MKVLKHGKYYNKSGICLVCEDCKCTFLITLNDVLEYKKLRKVKKTHWVLDGCFTEVTKYKYYCKCPECKAECFINDDKYDQLIKIKNCKEGDK